MNWKSILKQCIVTAAWIRFGEPVLEPHWEGPFILKPKYAKKKETDAT